MESTHFSDPFLENIALAFRKRRKAIKYHASRAELSKVYEKMRAEDAARLEIDLAHHDGSSLRMWAWPDRFLWLDARRLEKNVGWAWSWTQEGRLVGTCTAPDLIKALEDTFDTIYGVKASGTAALGKPWAKLLAQGPKAVR
jgi:hypothetical protein